VKRIYIAGPMTGIRNYNFPAFFTAADSLRRNGFDPINPAEMDIKEGDVTVTYPVGDPSGVVALSPTWDRSKVMARDLDAVRTSDGVLVLAGWRNSLGALDEVTCALLYGVDVYPSISYLLLGLPIATSDLRQMVRRSKDRLREVQASDGGDPVVDRLFTGATKSEPEELLDTFRQMLSLATSDGAAKRRAGLKPCWKDDGSHPGAFFRHLRRFMEGETVDPDSGADPRVHMAWRLLAWAYVDTKGAAVGRLDGTVDRPTDGGN